MDISSTKILANDVAMPRLGLGVWKAADDEEVINAVKWAIETGYRSIDTAAIYKNERGVGQGIRESGIKREELFVTSKVWNDEQGYESTLAAFEESLEKLQLDYLDLYLIHWPVAGKYKDTWRALEKLYKDGRVRAIGVCNFHPHHLDDLITDAEIKPMVNQVELHPLLNQKELRDYCAKHEIAIEAWSPLGQGHLLEDERLAAIGEKYHKTPAQIILRWDLENDIVTIPKSVNQERIAQNADIFDFELTDEDRQAIDNMHTGERFGTNPDEFDEK
ncbi:aldo/keto reductase [Vagococcus lutrae]|uniref:Aldo/keto reductase n=1 Tax=Vagococcus lutrae LBD1 TaxID=1408226 RepID=V6Q3R0_9ENTE|nr:aldo/keto reductase [Vagococcus lutrae]EST89392.1 aldo/keto reductase [Vagococcus lutrae LBD1]NKZ27478.1 aldo/keto reductase [Vagococcus lutrae]WEB81696.1 aldo/keto reductase [Vagococcus lutrae]